MKKVLTVLIALMLILLYGCLTTEYSSSTTTPKTTTPPISSFTVEIVSEPSGAVIEVNDNYVGETPVTIELEGWASTRTFARSHTIVAHPLYEGGYTQVKIFIGWHKPDHTYGDPIPEKMYFNMNLVPASGKK